MREILAKNKKFNDSYIKKPSPNKGFKKLTDQDFFFVGELKRVLSFFIKYFIHYARKKTGWVIIRSKENIELELKLVQLNKIKKKLINLYTTYIH